MSSSHLCISRNETIKQKWETEHYCSVLVPTVGTETAQFPEKEYINGIFLAVLEWANASI